MADRSKRFDPFLLQVGAAELKQMVRAYGGKSTMRKQECIDFLRAALANPQVVRETIDSLEAFERNALAFVKQMGGAIDYQTLGISVLASGFALPPRFSKSDAMSGIASHMVSRGLLLSQSEYNPGYFSAYAGNGATLFSDPRLLAHVGFPQSVPATLRPCAPPSTTLVRLPPTVILEIIGFLQALVNIGGLGLTQKGELRANDLRRFQKALSWSSDDLKMDGLLFKDALTAIIHALRHSDFLELANATLVLKRPIAEVATQEYAAQVSTMLDGFLRLTEWNEPNSPSWNTYGTHHQEGRVALMITLASLPFDDDHFYTVDEFDRLLYVRIGEHFTLRGSVQKYLQTYRETPAEIRQMEAEWQVERREAWLKQERIWLESALSTWLYYLGIVELGMEGRRLVAFRLTALGKAVLHPTRQVNVGSPSKVEHGGVPGNWIVQPNFDVIVYLDRTPPTQLAFMERHAERTQSQQYIAHYRLTRDSVYRGLESGTTVVDFLEELAQHSQAPLPQNVVVEINEWAALREKVILSHRTHLLEFATSAARQDALTAGLAGTLVGDRFLLVAPVDRERYRRALKIGSSETVDYSKPLLHHLQVDEAGLITVRTEILDLLLEAQLDQWAERQQDGSWQLTAASVARQVKAGARVDELIALLNNRLASAFPSILSLALRNWAGRGKGIELESFTVVRLKRSDVMHAVLSSKRLKPHLRGRLGDDILLFDSAHMQEVREFLDWAGLNISPLFL
jgi:hypothetical protein